jgi:YHS domain-containing protein
MKNITFIIISVFTVILANAQKGTLNLDPNNLALQGYDAVVYFKDDKARKGSDAISSVYNGATYYFSSKENREAFDSNPEKYIPQCGGWCAWGVAEKNKKYPINPETFKVINGKLYLFFNAPLNGKVFNSIEPWNENEAKLLPKVDINWATLKNKK